MARISTYNLAEKVTEGDKWIGTDSGFYNKTKNFTPLKLADYFNSSEKIDSANSLRFWYQTLNFQENRSFGTISFENEIGASVPLSSITSFLLSKRTEGNIFVYDFLNSIEDSKILLHQGNTINIYGIYEVTNIEEYSLDSNFIKVDVSFIRGNGSLVEDLSYLLSIVDFALEDSLNWGNINGNISDQTDLQEALDAKQNKPTYVINNNISGTHPIDFNVDTHRLTLIGNTTFTEINLPASGFSKTITLHVSGNFGVVFPASWTQYISGEYDGTATLNTIVIETIGTERKVQISQPD